ncbi:hypothetical protein HHI36_002424 [Cryptolaemus montrouzieri]|uniref:HTH CENPB-type domain-containing protein n=1 Tax=Cryptolaemus montrouzieri TaxID=559131 RepID=A0ABD2PAN4_9CUCU
MPRKYRRKIGTPVRAAWSEEALCKAFGEMDKGQVGVNEISRRYGIPSRTLRRRYAKKSCEKLTLGKHPTLDFDNEKRLVAHIQKLAKAGFPTTRQDVRRLAFEFAEKLGLENSFNKETRMAGQHWLKSFLERHPELSSRQAEETKNWMLSHKDRKINRYVAGKLIGNAWARAATSSNAVNGFRACGIFPYNPSAIPDSYFAISDNSFQNLDEENLAQGQPVARELDANADVTSYYVEPQPGPSSSTVNSEREPDFGFLLYEDLAADAFIIPLEGNVSPSILSQNHIVETVEVITPEVITPSKYLNECSPIPKIPVPLYKRGKQGAAFLNSEEHINSKKAKLKGKAKKHTPDKPRKNNQKSVPKKKRPRFSSESEQEFDESDSDQTKSDKVNTQCRECFDDYASTKSTADWIQCLMCKLWLHEDCTVYGGYCNRCGHKKKLAALKANLAKVNSKNK